MNSRPTIFFLALLRNCPPHIQNPVYANASAPTSKILLKMAWSARMLEGMSRPISVECVKYFVSKQFCLLFLVNFNQLLDADYFCPQCRKSHQNHQNRTAITNVVAINFMGAVFL